MGGSAFYSFKASPGQLLQASLGSQKFVPLLRCMTSAGTWWGRTTAAPTTGRAASRHMVVQEGLYRLQVSSLGDGGGGDFRLALRETKLKELEIGGRGQGTLQPNGTDFWAFSGKEGKTVLFSVRSPVCDPAVSLHSPDGVRSGERRQGRRRDGQPAGRQAAQDGTVHPLDLIPARGGRLHAAAHRRGLGPLDSVVM